MIFEKCSQWQYFANLAPEAWNIAFNFLTSATVDTPVGRVELRGDEIFALVQEYDTKSIATAKIEAHRRYADIQVILSGCEFIGIGHLSGLIRTTEYEADKDCELFSCTPQTVSFVRLVAGDFMFLAPGEGHAPCLSTGDVPTHVKKIVIKIDRKLLP